MAKARQRQQQEAVISLGQGSAEAGQLTRAAAVNKVVAAITGKTTLQELARKADDLFVEGGGESKLRAAILYTRRALETMEAMGVVKLTRPTDVLVERVRGK